MRPRGSRQPEPGNESQPDLWLMSEYGLRMPLWGQGADTDDPDATSKELGLSTQLTRDLVEWQDSFATHLASLTWDSRANADAYASRGGELLARLRTELPGITIEIDLWPVDPEWMPKR